MTDEEEARLDAAIRAATGSNQPHIGGGFDGAGRVAWFEEEGGSFFLHTAGPGVPDVHREIETYNPFFGCTVSFVGWFGDEVVSIYREKHRTLVWAVPVHAPASQRLTDIDDNAVVDGDTAFFEGDEPGLVEAIALPSFAPRSPMPFDDDFRWAHIERHGDAIELGRWDPAQNEYVGRVRLRLPSAHQRAFADASLAGRVERALTAPDLPPPLASLIVACTASAFWRRSYDVYTTYHGKTRGSGESLHWLPVYWHEHLVKRGRDDEARELLAFLEASAAPLAKGRYECGWDPDLSFDEGVLALATRHVRRRAGALARVIRTATLPEHHFCYLFDGRGGEPRAVNLDGLPRSVTSVWEQLVAAKPISLSRRDASYRTQPG